MGTHLPSDFEVGGIVLSKSFELAFFFACHPCGFFVQGLKGVFLINLCLGETGLIT